MVDVVNRRCKTPMCDVIVKNPKYRGFCCRCFVHTFPDHPILRNHKTKERAVADHMRTVFPDLTWVLDRPVGPSRRRPDLFVDLGPAALIVEVDEHQHDVYDCTCENRRLMEIFRDLGMAKPIVVIRFNPDAYVSRESRVAASCWTVTRDRGIAIVAPRHRKAWERRLEVLSNTVRHYIDLLRTVRKKCCHHELREVDTVRLFYDGDDDV